MFTLYHITVAEFFEQIQYTNSYLVMVGCVGYTVRIVKLKVV